MKWAGGKQALAARLIPHFPESFNRYYEPFVGGASVFFELAPAHATIGDENRWLIDTYMAIRDHVDEVAATLEKIENTREEFLRVRAIAPNELDEISRAAHFIYLNKTCFRGLFRVNRKGHFNVPYGDYDRRYFDLDNLRAASLLFSKADICAGDFESTIKDVSRGDFIYMDPPYWKLGGHSDFNRYTESQFRASDHIRLAAVCRELNSRGVKWALSNSDTPFVRELFEGFRAIKIASRREINLQSEKRDMVELLIVNYA